MYFEYACCFALCTCESNNKFRIPPRCFAVDYTLCDSRGPYYILQLDTTHLYRKQTDSPDCVDNSRDVYVSDLPGRK